MAEDYLNAGIDAAKQGDLEKARSYLANAVKENPRSEAGWLWLGRSLTDKERQKYCFEKVLRLNSQNIDAQNELDQLFLSDVTKLPAIEPNLVDPILDKPDDTHQAKHKADWKSDPIFLSVMGVFLGLCVCGIPLLFMINSGLLDPWNKYFQANKPIFATATPFSLPTSVSTLQRPEAIPSTASNPPVAADNNTWQARNLISQEKYAEAITVLNPTIEAAPHLDEPYYLRALSYYKLMKQQRSQSEFEDYLSQAMTDIDQAIAIRQDQGDYYMLRQYILVDLAGNQNYRVDAEHVSEYALENAIAALSLGSTLDEYPDRIYITDLLFTNHCQQAVNETQKLIDQTDPNNPSIGGLYHIQSQAYICLGDVNKALKMLDKSMFNNINMEWKYELKARYLYQAGRSEEALALLNQLIEQKPSYDGWRYYLRSLIYQEQGQREKAEQDLMMGAGNTWSRVGLFSYVQGKMALEDGNKEEGIYLLQEAEASLDYLLVPLQGRIQDELKTLGAQPLQITPSVLLEATSIPTIPGRPTARPLATPSLLSTTSATLTPTPGVSLPFNVSDAIIVDMATGTGNLTLLANDYPVLRFQPAEVIPVKSVKSLVVHLVPASEETRNPDIQIFFWVPRGGGWRYIAPTWGDNVIERASDYVLPEGDIFLAIHNWGGGTVTFENVVLTLVVETQDGAIKTYGLK